MVGLCASDTDGAAAAARYLGADHGHGVSTVHRMCAFPPAPQSVGSLISTQNLICADQANVSRLCAENQLQLYWSGHEDAVALAFLDKRHRDTALLARSRFTERFGRDILVVFPYFNNVSRSFVFEEVT